MSARSSGMLPSSLLRLLPSTQVHVHYQSASEVVVSWLTGRPIMTALGQGPMPGVPRVGKSGAQLTAQHIAIPGWYQQHMCMHNAMQGFLPCMSLACAAYPIGGSQEQCTATPAEYASRLSRFHDAFLRTAAY